LAILKALVGGAVEGQGHVLARYRRPDVAAGTKAVIAVDEAETTIALRPLMNTLSRLGEGSKPVPEIVIVAP
jgi:hypothetical protein